MSSPGPAPPLLEGRRSSFCLFNRKLEIENRKLKELPFIDWIRSQSAFDPAAVPVGPGDDMAVVTSDGRDLLVTIDQVLDGTHFILADCGPWAAGRKAMARSLSDVAAMAAVPVAAVAAVALPPGFSRQDGEEIYHGLRAAGDAFDCPLVGGDVAAWEGAMAIDVTVIARVADGHAPVLRSGAKPGDAICVTGTLGAAWRTDRHLTFTPRIAEALALAGRYDVHAMIDLSDGLTLDLRRLCEASGVGAVIQAAGVPIHADAAALCPADPLAAALGDGEDYELLFTLPPHQADALIAEPLFAAPVAQIGQVHTDQAVRIVHADGRCEDLGATGWEHET